MSNKLQPFYDPLKSYEDNDRDGPFGIFRVSPTEQLPKPRVTQFLGFSIDIAFGIPAGPLLNSKFIEGAWRWGFSLATYKTVRGNVYPTHPFPNVIKVRSKARDIHPGDVVTGDLHVDSIDVTRDGITNSFGVPSKEPRVWQKDVKEALGHMKKGRVMILSFMGTKKEEMDRDAYIRDFAKTCREARATGAPVLEVNFSCPNFGKEGLICNDVATSRDILQSLHRAKGNVPLLVKIGYFGREHRNDLDALLEAIHTYADGVVSINTIAAKVVSKKGNQILPGNPVRLFSGICGTAIRWAGLEMSEYIVSHKGKKNWKNFVVVGVGGVTTPGDYVRYTKLGVDAVQSATGAMWRPTLAVEIRKQLVSV